MLARNFGGNHSQTELRSGISCHSLRRGATRYFKEAPFFLAVKGGGEGVNRANSYSIDDREPCNRKDFRGKNNDFGWLKNEEEG